MALQAGGAPAQLQRAVGTPNAVQGQQALRGALYGARLAAPLTTVVLFQAGSGGVQQPFSAASGITGSASITLAGATLSAAGVVLIQGSATITLSSATLSAAARTLVQGGAAVALADAQLVGAGLVAVRGQASITLVDAQLSGAAGVRIRGTLAVTLQDATLTALGATGGGAGPITGQASITLQSAVLTATGTVRDLELHPVYITLPPLLRQLRLTVMLRTLPLDETQRIDRLAGWTCQLILPPARRIRPS